MKLKGFFIKEGLNKKKQQDCILNIYLQHIKDKKYIRYWPNKDYFLGLLNGIKDKVYSN